ncbi:MAG TPA: hypothetical protein VN375_10475 [Vicinamibacteria bacterium]|jgi:hypothetical protein|nr:hypothetical protein [Vicinamibacteria bacterium]
MTLAGFSLLLLLAPQNAEPLRPAPPRPGLSWADADALARQLEELDRRFRAGAPAPAQSVLVTEAQLNSYLNLVLKMPPGVSNLEIHLDAERLLARALVDLDRVQGRLPAQGPFNPLSLLSGTVPAALKGRLPSRDGFASLQFEEVRLGAFPIPVSFLAQIISSATRTPENPQGFDIQSPFRLPYALKRVRLQPGQAVLEF